NTRFRLGARGALLLAFEHEQRGAPRDLIAALHGEPCQTPGERGRNPHVLALDVSRIYGGRGILAGGQGKGRGGRRQQPANGRRRGDHARPFPLRDSINSAASARSMRSASAASESTVCANAWRSVRGAFRCSVMALPRRIGAPTAPATKATACGS